MYNHSKKTEMLPLYLNRLEQMTIFPKNIDKNKRKIKEQEL